MNQSLFGYFISKKITYFCIVLLKKQQDHLSCDEVDTENIATVSYPPRCCRCSEDSTDMWYHLVCIALLDI